MVIRRFLTLACLALCLSAPAYALTKVETSVDRNPAIQGEYLVLSIKADDDVDNASLDTSGLLKDFIVGRTSVSRSTQIMNFDASKETRWQILLAPKKTGTVIIPAMTIDNISSDPIELKVAAPGSQPEQMKNLFIRSSVSTETAYVGQLITYKVKLYLGVELQRGVLSAPNVEGAQLKQLGDDVDGAEIIDGRRYRVIERTYSLIADEPGTLSLSGASFSGDVLVESSRRGGMFSFNESRPMQAKAAPSEIEVLPIPEGYQGDWLVSDLVVLKEDWKKDVQYQVGVPITRNISLLASNADDTSLPGISLSLPDTFKVYPEKPQRKTYVRDKQVVAQLNQTTAIVPTQPGSYTLPEIRIPWWNSRTQKQEFATLPARNISVAPASASQESPQLTAVTPQSDSSGLWPAISALFALLWLATSLLWYRHYQAYRYRATPSGADEGATSHAPKASDALRQFETACRNGKTGDALVALQRHMSQQAGKPMTLTDIAALSCDLDQAIQAIQHQGYSLDRQGLEVEKVITAVKNAPKAAPHSTQSALRPLNPL
ncbi:BatD family protein [Shewanella alkalitolerans]|uniref:BatD family protein n=1 Tax=Shewanella alkalitolerans TaxID=2864209 RepID=UPI001C660731|nr:BatD family protein [Shewanella alkalitolerans]QYJ96370.1 BatD family protein [Shewanella alkalitolerans]